MGARKGAVLDGLVVGWALHEVDPDTPAYGMTMAGMRWRRAGAPSSAGAAALGSSSLCPHSP
jgi:hypothetical protein